MTETRISSTELARSIGDVLARLRYRNERFIIVKNGKAVAVLAPYPDDAEKSSLKSALRSWAESREPDGSLADALDEAGASDVPPRESWESP